MKCSAAIFLASVATGHSITLNTDMQPELVAKTLKNVEDKWKEQAAAFIECNATQDRDCSDEPSAFSKSCSVVVGAVVQGSSGDKLVARDYMADICSQSALKGWHQQHCLGLKAALNTAMTADAYSNRETFTSTKMCTKFWGEFVAEEQKRFVKEEAERKVAAQKAAEAAAKKATEDAQDAKAEAMVKAEEAQKAKEAAEKKAAEEAARKKIEDAQDAKAEAMVKAEEAAAKLAHKKAEAEQFAKKAKEAQEAAALAEHEHEKAKATLADQASASTKKQEAVVVQEASAKVASAPLNVVDKLAPKQGEPMKPPVALKVVAPVTEVAPVKAVPAVAPVKAEPAVAAVKPAEAAPVKAADAKKPAFLEQDPCAGCTEGLSQAYQICASKHGNPCAETNAAGLVISGPGTKKDIGCCMKKEKHDRCLKCSGMDCAHGTCKVNKKYYNQRTIGEKPLDDKAAMKKAGWGK